MRPLSLAFLLAICICVLALSTASSSKDQAVRGPSHERFKLRRKEPREYKRESSKPRPVSRSSSYRVLKSKKNAPDHKQEDIVQHLWPNSNKVVHRVLESELKSLRKHNSQSYDKLKQLSLRRKQPKVVSLSRKSVSQKKAPSDENIIIRQDKIEDERRRQEKLLVESKETPMQLEVSVNDEPSRKKINIKTRMVSINENGGLIFRNVNANSNLSGLDLDDVITEKSL